MRWVIKVNKEIEYTNKTNSEHIKTFGQYFTHYEVADFMCSWACKDAGTVLDPGSREDLKVGDRVTALPLSPCGVCEACTKGDIRMKTEWDYTNLADAYLKRPDYAENALEKMLTISTTGGVKRTVCDVGAGVAHLTLFLARKGFTVHAVEPNDAMRKNGMCRTEQYKNVKF